MALIAVEFLRVLWSLIVRVGVVYGACFSRVYVGCGRESLGVLLLLMATVTFGDNYACYFSDTVGISQ